jgi:hypothetical protein
LVGRSFTGRISVAIDLESLKEEDE